MAAPTEDWFRALHSELQRRLQSAFESAGGEDEEVRDLERIKLREWYAEALLELDAMPIDALLSQLALQALPRYSRAYAAVRLESGLLEDAELRAAYDAHSSVARTTLKEEPRRQLSAAHEASRDPLSEEAIHDFVTANELFGSASPSADTSAMDERTPAGPVDAASPRSAPVNAVDSAGAAVGGRGPVLGSFSGKPRRARTEPAVGAGVPARGQSAISRWKYVDDAGAEQGPFDTEQMRAWLAKGYLSHARLVGPADETFAEMRPLSKWAELASARFALNARVDKVQAKQVLPLAQVAAGVRCRQKQPRRRPWARCKARE